MGHFKAGDVAIYQNMTGNFSSLNGELASVLSDISHCEDCKRLTYQTHPLVALSFKLPVKLGPFIVMRVVEEFCTLEIELRPLGDKGIEDSVIHGHVIIDDNRGMDVSVTPKKKETV